MVFELHCLEIDARVSRRDGNRVGMAFDASPSSYREAIEDYVTQRLATARI